ncbi:MAG: carboxypeptidase regulatory-like domain-containing protein, partial [Theionarchaea archaeon]|nr:carboxypeptidase regulatory-like domain-containing protein [Theionarchaea archaeon]
YIRSTDIPEGYHVVKASKFGYTEDSKEVYVTAGKTETVYLNISGPLTGSIKVYVYDNYNVGVSKADVYLDGEYWGDTDRKGYTRVTDVPEGYHTVTASKSGYGEDSTTVYVTAGETETVYLYLTGPPPTGSIRVSVKDESDNRLSEASVYLDGKYQGETNRSGYFLIEEVPQGNHTIMASKFGFKDDSREVYVEAGQKAKVDLCLVGPPRGTIKVYVRDNDDSDVFGASVYLDSSYEGETDGEGFLRIDNVPEGYHTVKASKFGYEDSKNVLVEAGKIVRVELCLKEGLSPTGTIKVFVKDEFDNLFSGASVYLDGSHQGETNRSGFLQIDNVSEGYHTVRASKFGYEEDSEEVDIKGGELKTINLTLSKIDEPRNPSLALSAPKVDGLAVTINGAATPGTSNASITRVHWEWGDDSSGDHWFPASHTYSQAGTYTVTVTAYQSDGLQIAKSVDVKLEEVEEEKTGSIKIIVEDENGDRVEGATVWREPDPIGICFTTDSIGECLIQYVEEGWYTVTTSKEGYEDDSKSIYVRAGETKTVYLTLGKMDESTAAEIQDQELEPITVCGKERSTYEKGNIVVVKFNIKNTGDRKQVFYYGYAVSNDIGNSWDPERSGEIEIDHGKISEGLLLKWEVPDLNEAPRCGYDIYIIVWGKKSDESFYELDRSESLEFSVAERVQIEEVDVWFEGTSEHGVARLCFTDDTYENVRENACMYAQKITEEAEKRGYDVRKSLSSMAYEIYVHVLYYPLEKTFRREEDLDSKPIDIELDSNQWVSSNLLIDYTLPVVLENLPPCVVISASISIGDLESSYTPGDTVEIGTYVKNTGDIYHIFIVECSIYDPNDKVYDFPHEEIELGPGESEIVRFPCNISTGALYGDYKAAVSVWGKDTGIELENRLDYDRKYFTVSTGTIGATISLEELNPSYVPEDIVKIRTYITNTGDILHTFIVECLIIDPNNNVYSIPYEDVKLSPGESETVQFLYGIPVDALDGEYQVITSVWERDTGIKLENRLDRDKKHFTVSSGTIDAIIFMGYLESSYAPGDHVEIVTDVTNTGDIFHTFIVECSIYDPEDNVYDFPYEEIELGPGESEIVRFLCNISTGAPEGKYQLIVSVWERYASDGKPENKLDHKEEYFTVTEGDGTPSPDSITITSPTSGSEIYYMVNITVSTTGCVDKVQFYIDGSLKYTDASAPFDYTWDTTIYDNGSHTIRAKAYCSDSGDFVAEDEIICEIKNTRECLGSIMLFLFVLFGIIGIYKRNGS